MVIFALLVGLSFLLVAIVSFVLGHKEFAIAAASAGTFWIVIAQLQEIIDLLKK